VPGSGLRHYDVEVRREVEAWTPWLTEFKSSQAVYNADADKTYHFRARGVDHGGNVGEWSEEFSVRIDATPPLMLAEPIIPTGEGPWTSLDTLTFTFAFVDPESGIGGVEVAVGTAKELFDVYTPKVHPYPTTGELTLEDLPLINSLTYYVGVRAQNQAGAWSEWAWSDEVLVAIPGPDSTMTFPEGRASTSKIPINISVTDPRGYNVTLGDLRMRSATRSGDEWTWSDWERISNTRTSIQFDGKRGFRYQFMYRAQNELGSWGEFVDVPEDYWVFINNPPVANGGPDQLVDAGATVEFSADASEDRDGDALTYNWDFGDGTTSKELFASHKYKKAGLYVVTLTVSDGYEESTAHITVYVQEKEETPGFGPWVAMLGLIVAALVASTLVGTRKR
jgi:hypothetical protein